MAEEPAKRGIITDKISNVVSFLRSCTKECSESIEGIATGEIPRWLQGSLLRNGGGLIEIGPDKYNHAFDSLALLHKFRIQDGRVTYSNRFLHSETYKRNMKANRIVVTEFGTRGHPDPCKTLFQRFMSVFTMEEFSDNDVVNIFQLGDQFYACSETNFIHRVDPETLETTGRIDLSKYLAVNSATAHPHTDMDGTQYNMGNGFKLSGPTYNVLKIPPASDEGDNPFHKGSIMCSIPARYRFYPSYYHSFGITDNYIVFVEQPLLLSIWKMLWFHVRGKAYVDALEWHPELKSYFHVINRYTGQPVPINYSALPFMMFHHINAYEESGHLVVDMCCYNDANIMKALCVSELEKIKDDPQRFVDMVRSEARRYVLPLNVPQDKTESENLVKLPGCKATAFVQQDQSVLCLHEALTESGRGSSEMPRINYAKYNGRKYRFFYALGIEESDLTTYIFIVHMIGGRVDVIDVTSCKQHYKTSCVEATCLDKYMGDSIT
ncbi:carotenoid-cleaving dioxygenase, mitochondrial-like isoform X2 [Tachypleus tridentatus]|uniref:carotenoid-cleaving dioxygenase, mitochondrial-like isoform X2 n=1 Tax=Tachypleus tridentatus TaxID=6853 RepID=UPI003FD394B3